MACQNICTDVEAPVCIEYLLVMFCPEWVTYHAKLATKLNIEYPSSWVTRRTHETPFNLFRVEGPKSTDSLDCGPTRHV